MIQQLYPIEVITIINPRSGNGFKVNGQRLKNCAKRFNKNEEDAFLEDLTTLCVLSCLIVNLDSKILLIFI